MREAILWIITLLIMALYLLAMLAVAFLAWF